MKKTIRPLCIGLLASAFALPFTAHAVVDQKAQGPLLLAEKQKETRDAGKAGSDTWITTKVKSKLLADDATPGMDIEVETKDGVVSLSGTVASEAEKEAAVTKARSVEGVRSVMADGLSVAD